MPNTTLKTKIKHKIDTTANWTTNSNVILENGEIGFERTNNDIKIKVGDGSTTWANLPYVVSNNTSNSMDYNDLQNKPSLATVATSGSYNDLSNKPNIPTDTSDLTNTAGFITSTALTNIPSRVSYISGNLAAWNSNGNLVDSGYQIVVSNTAPTVNNQNVITFVI